MPVGFRVFQKRNLPPKELVESFRTIPAANIADCMGRHNAMIPEIRLMTKPGGVNMAGVALTVKTCYGDNLMIHQGLDMAVEGDVLVIANEGGRNRSLLGEIMYRYAERKNLAGIVLDAPIRDALEISGGSVPLYATGSTPGGPYKEGPGEVNVPVSCGGVHVNPGDIIVGDPDGVIVIPRQDAEGVLEAVRAFQQNDRRKLRAAIDGTADRSWVMKQLEAKKCEFVDGVYGD
ncbi:MAG TPA: RraA family protein [Syntrophobacteraceae bacterium]|nr:RraA family protein [Aminivibrio sp.]HQN20190.1 RraA family protein [Syntrophobacteraceae bacterium]